MSSSPTRLEEEFLRKASWNLQLMQAGTSPWKLPLILLLCSLALPRYNASQPPMQMEPGLFYPSTPLNSTFNVNYSTSNNISTFQQHPNIPSSSMSASTLTQLLYSDAGTQINETSAIQQQFENWFQNLFENNKFENRFGKFSNGPDKGEIAQQLEAISSAMNSVAKINKSMSTSLATKRTRIFMEMLCQMKSVHVWGQNAVQGCPAFFDNYTCWPPGALEHVYNGSCPLYLQTTTVYLRCNGSGYWNLQSGSQFNYGNKRDICTVYDSCNLKECRTPPTRWFRIFTNILRYGSILGYVLSLIATSLAIFIFVTFKRLHCSRNTVHLNLFAAFLLRSVLAIFHYTWFIDESVKIPTWGCKTFETLWNYSMIASWLWLLVEALYLHNIIYFNVFKEPNVKPYIVLGWCGYLPVIVVWVFVRIYLDDKTCWQKYDNANYMWILKVPVMSTFVINFILFINMIRELFVKVKTSSMAETEKYKKLAKSTGILFVLFGIHYFLLIFAMNLVDNTRFSTALLILLFFELVPASIQGFVVALTYCHCNGEVQRELARQWKTWRQHQSFKRQHSSTGLFPLKFAAFGNRRTKGSETGNGSGSRANGAAVHIFLSRNGNELLLNDDQELAADLIAGRDKPSASVATVGSFLTGTTEVPPENDEEPLEPYEPTNTPLIPRSNLVMSSPDSNKHRQSLWEEDNSNRRLLVPNMHY